MWSLGAISVADNVNVYEIVVHHPQGVARVPLHDLLAIEGELHAAVPSSPALAVRVPEHSGQGMEAIHFARQTITVHGLHPKFNFLITS